jgi:hypothetical protein
MLFKLYFGVCIMELLTFIRNFSPTEDSSRIHLQPIPMLEAASSTEILVTIFQNKGDIRENSVPPNRDNFKSRASFILYASPVERLCDQSYSIFRIKQRNMIGYKFRLA